MAKRNCPTLQKSLDWCEGMPSHPGVRRRVYFCNKNLIVAFPTLPRDEFGRPTSAVLEGNFELADGAYWQYLDINIDKSTVTSEPQGEAPSQTQLNKATFVHNGIDEDATAAAGWLNNSDNVYIFEDMPGKFRVLGNDKWRTLTTVNQDMGQGTNPASTTINVEVTDEVAAPFYNGSIETEDGTVMPDADSEGSASGATVQTKMLDLGFGETGQIEVSPVDGNWSFESSKSTIASVNGNGLVTAGRTTGTARISCMYKGTEIKRITVTVGIMQGEEPDPNDPETPSGEEDVTPSITPRAITLQKAAMQDVNFNQTPATGWTLVSEDPDVVVVEKEPGGRWYAEGGQQVGQTVIHAIYGEQMINIQVKTICPQNNLADAITLAPGESVEFDLIPTSGWHGVFDQVEYASVEVNGGHVKVTGMNDTDGSSRLLILTNDDGQRLNFNVTVDESNAG